LTVRKDQVSAELHTRTPQWTTPPLSQPVDRIVFPDIADIGPLLATLYRQTPLWQSAWSQL